jgi:catechol 2,3-dioxygenase-like lactoylglutathione lyase family enzyme
MLINHIGVVNRSDREAVSFYKGFLGLEKTREFIVAPELSSQLFSVTREIPCLVFEKAKIKIEVFIDPDFILPSPNVSHIGFWVDNVEQLIEDAAANNVEVITGSHQQKTVYFVKDFSGNLIEIKQKQ